MKFKLMYDGNLLTESVILGVQFITVCVFTLRFTKAEMGWVYGTHWGRYKYVLACVGKTA
jgi:hypothetical protein